MYCQTSTPNLTLGPKCGRLKVDYFITGSDMSAIPTFTDAEQFKLAVSKHREEGWRNLEEDKKLFVCWYIRSGHSTHRMSDVGISDREIEMYLSDPMCQAAVSDISEKYAEVTTFTRSGLRARVSRALDMALGEVERPFYTKDGNQQFRKVVDLTAAARLLEMAEKYVTDPEKIDETDSPAPWEDR